MSEKKYLVADTNGVLATVGEIVKIADNVYLSNGMLQHDKEKTMDMADREVAERMAEFIYKNHLYQREVIQEPEHLRLAYRLDVVKMGDDAERQKCAD